MDEYIERESTLHRMKVDIRPPFAVVADMPAADVAPVRHGRWIDRIDNDTPMHECSVCGARAVKGLYEYENPNRYCYHCGARMDLEV